MERVCWVIAGLSSDAPGAEDVAALALANQADGGHAVVASCGGPWVAPLAGQGVTHVTLGLDARGPLALHMAAAGLKKALRRLGVTRLISVGAGPSWCARGAAKALGVPWLSLFQPPSPHDGWYARWLQSATWGGDRVIIDDGLESRLPATARDRAVVVPGAVDGRVFDPDTIGFDRAFTMRRGWRLKDGPPVILIPGPLEGDGTDGVILDALARVADRPFQMVITGTERAPAAAVRGLSTALKERGLRERCRIVDTPRDRPAACLAADLMLTPWGRLGAPALEAVAMARPVIAAGDHPTAESLGTALAAMLDADFETRAAMAAAARPDARDYTIERRLSAIMSI